MSTVEELLAADAAVPLLEPPRPEPARPDPHDMWLALGYCPYIDLAKTWCNGLKGHESLHHAPNLMQDGSIRNITLR